MDGADSVSRMLSMQHDNVSVYSLFTTYVRVLKKFQTLVAHDFGQLSKSPVRNGRSNLNLVMCSWKLKCNGTNDASS